jgi:hypothetical protein
LNGNRSRSLQESLESESKLSVGGLAFPMANHFSAQSNPIRHRTATPRGRSIGFR